MTSPSPAASSSALNLLTVPFTFTQEGLLTSRQFIQTAQERGHDLTEGVLEDLFHARMLTPLYRLSKDKDPDLRFESVGSDGHNPRGWALRAAALGSLRDAYLEGSSPTFPIRRPDSAGPRWSDGYLYSSWDLLRLRRSRQLLRWTQEELPFEPSSVEAFRRQTLALAALTPLFLPGILGQLSTPAGETEHDLWTFQDEADVESLLRMVNFPPSDLEAHAEKLLSDARFLDPMIDWLPLLRHAPYRSWKRMKKAPLEAMWLRAAAEVLLQAHELLAERDALTPLRNLTGERWHYAQHDRLAPRYGEAAGLERALGEFGLSPHPRVILVLEGKTEMIHIRLLLEEYGLAEPQYVRLQDGGGTKLNPSLLARYGVTPRIGAERDDGWDLEATPSAIYLMMDPEGKFETAVHCQNERRKIQNAIREDVKAQGGDISQPDLDLLVTVETWGLDTYEIANFTDDELVEGLTDLARGRRHRTTPEWQAKLRGAIELARANHNDISVVATAMGIGPFKVDLAHFLWPMLREKCVKDAAADNVEIPVLRLMDAVRLRVAQMDRASVLAKPPPAN
jgi:hypothetical protein